MAGTASLSIIVLSLATLLCSATAESLIVNTKLGPVAGYTDVSTHGREFFAFNGIPFAKPPIGKLRFKDPEPIGSWDDPLDATGEPPLCPQYPYPNILTKNWTQILGDEDCLLVNVFTPKLNDNGPSGLPVMVFIHGGGWFTGGASLYPPHAFMNADVVLVVLQYRLGMLGFLSSEDEFAPGNLGLKDQALALKWVQENIESFGGDPGSVTAFGESAGSASINFHMLDNKSKGLFQRAIMQSGQATCPLGTIENPGQIASTISQKLGCPTICTETMVQCLQKIPIEEISNTYADFFELGILPLVAAPYVDGEFLSDHPAKLLADGKHANIDVMMGVTKDEGAFISTMVYSVHETFSALKENLNEKAAVSLGFSQSSYKPFETANYIYQQYMGDNIGLKEKPDEFTTMLSDRFFNILFDNTALDFIRHSTNNKVYMYDFEHRGKQSFVDEFSMEFVADDKKTFGNWVSHADDLPYLFPGYEFSRNGLDEVDRKVSDMMVKIWTNFAKYGNPTPDESLDFVWEPAQEDTLRHLTILERPAMSEDQRAETREFWDALPLDENVIAHPEKFPEAALHLSLIKQGQGKQEL